MMMSNMLVLKDCFKRKLAKYMECSEGKMAKKRLSWSSDRSGQDEGYNRDRRMASMNVYSIEMGEENESQVAEVTVRRKRVNRTIKNTSIENCNIRK